MAAKLDILINATNNASGPINQVKSALDGLGGMAKASAVAVGAASVAAIAGITAVVATGVSKAADMEQGIADIASIMGLAKDQTQPLADLINNLGLDPKLKVNATEAAEAIKNLGANGLTMSEIMDGAARNTVLLANATGADFGTAANVATDTMSLFNIKAEDMKAAVDGITGVTIASKFGIQDYALALAQGGGVAAVAGVEFDDFNATIAAISPYFASGSDAGTSFKTMLQRMADPTDKAMGAMKGLGLATEDGKNKFFDANGQMKSMSEIAGMLATATAGLSEEQKSQALSTIFGSDAIRAASALAETGSEKFDQLKGSIAGVNSETNASTRMDTFAGQLEILQGIVDSLTIQIGQAFLPILRNLANWATDFVSNNGAWFVDWFKKLGEWLQVIGPQVVTFSTVALKALGEVGAWLSGQGTTFANFNLLWWTLAEAGRKTIESLVQRVKDGWPNWVASFSQWAQSAWSWINDVAAPKMKDELAKLWTNTIKPWLDEKGNGIGTEMTGWAVKFLGFTTQVKASWDKAWPDIQKIVTGASNSITQDIDRIMTSLGKMGAWFSGGEGQGWVRDWSFIWTNIAKVMAWSVTASLDRLATFLEGLELLQRGFSALGSGDVEGLKVVLRELSRVNEHSKQSQEELFSSIGSILSGDFLTPRANGGPVTAGQKYLVGERGPELFVPKDSGTIIPNGATSNVNNTYNINLSGSGNAGQDMLSTVQLMQMMAA